MNMDYFIVVLERNHPWVPVTMALRVPSGYGWRSRPPDMEVRCEYIE